MAGTLADEDRVLRLPEVSFLTGLKKSAIYELMREGRFPQRGELADRASGWRLSDIRAWIASRFGPKYVPPANGSSSLDGSAVATAMAEWEDELDVMGPHANIDALLEHLSKAPGEGDLVSYLRGYIAGRTAALS